MIQISKLESLMNRVDLMDEFHDCYVKMLAEAWIAKDRERQKALKQVLLKQMAFLTVEMVRAQKEECGSEEIVQ